MHAPRRNLRPLRSLGFALLVGLPAGVRGGVEPPATTSPDDLAVELDRRFTQDVEPLLAKYCFECHGADDPAANLRLDRFVGVRDAVSGKIDVPLIREMVSSGLMPPDEVIPPTSHERLIITQWADAMSAYVPADAPIDPGWFTPHRLNRSEYRNTLRDLLGIDPAQVDLSAKLPRDDTGYGFDNIADVLSTSPLAIEQYLDAAEKAIATALGPVVEFGDHQKALRPLAGTTGQALPRGGFFLYSNGAATAKFEAPLTGEYLVRITAWETHAGDQHAAMALRVDGKVADRFEVSGTKESPQEFTCKLRLERGSRVIGAAFLNDYYEKGVADRNLGVESISVAGPLDESGVDRPAAWKAVMAPASGSGSEELRAGAVLRAFASRAYRRPADDAQVGALLGVYRREREGGRAFEPALRTALAATLVSPHFLFRTVAHPDAANPAARHPLDGYELASRLSYFLWSSMPDQALLDAAANGSLLTDEGLAAQVKRLLDDPRSSAFVENFSGQWLQLRALDGIAIDRSKFPEYDDQLRAAMKSEATLFFGDVVRSDRSVLDLVDSPETFLNAKLAAFYGVADVEGDQFRRVKLPQGSARGGVLTMGAVLTLTSNTTRTSPVKRGLFVLDQMLGAPPPPPPPDIPPLEQSHATSPDATVRERLAAHVAVPSCAACHNRLDPLGLTFEHFDAIGRWRETENGRPVDATGTLPGGVTLNGSGDLKQNILQRSDQFVEALSAKVLTYALGRGVEPFDRPAVRAIAQRTRANQDRMRALIESVVLSESFRTCRGRKSAHE